MFVYISDTPKLLRQYTETWVFVIFHVNGHQGKNISRFHLIATIFNNEHYVSHTLACLSHSVVSHYCTLQYIPRNMHTVFALLCFVVVIHWLIFPYPSGLLHWHCGNLTIAPVPAKQPWWTWINTSCEFIMNDCITTTKQSTTKPCAYFLGYTVTSLCLSPSVSSLPPSLPPSLPYHASSCNNCEITTPIVCMLYSRHLKLLWAQGNISIYIHIKYCYSIAITTVFMTS